MPLISSHLLPRAQPLEPIFTYRSRSVHLAAIDHHARIRPRRRKLRICALYTHKALSGCCRQPRKRRDAGRAPPPHRHCDSPYDRTQALSPQNCPALIYQDAILAPKSQYEIERDERIKRNEAFMLSIGIDPHGGGYMKQNKKKAPPAAPAPQEGARERAPPLVARQARAPDLRRVVGRRAPAPALARLRRPPRSQQPPRRALRGAARGPRRV